MIGPIIASLCVSTVAVAIVVLVLQWQHAQWTTTIYGGHRVRLIGASPVEVAVICAKLAVVDRWVDNERGLSPDERARMKAIIVEVYGADEPMTGTWMRVNDPGVAGTFDHRTFFLNVLGKSQDVILLRERAGTSLDVFHEFAYHAYPFVRFRDPDPEHRPDFDRIRKELEAAYV